MKKILITAFILFCSFLAACGEKDYTMDDFRNSESLRNEFKEKCKAEFKNEEAELNGKISKNCQTYSKTIMMYNFNPRKSDPNAWK